MYPIPYCILFIEPAPCRPTPLLAQLREVETNNNTTTTTNNNNTTTTTTTTSYTTTNTTTSMTPGLERRQCQFKGN